MIRAAHDAVLREASRQGDGTAGRLLEPGADRRLLVQDLLLDALERLGRPVVLAVEDGHMPIRRPWACSAESPAASPRCRWRWC